MQALSYQVRQICPKKPTVHPQSATSDCFSILSNWSDPYPEKILESIYNNGTSHTKFVGNICYYEINYLYLQT